MCSHRIFKAGIFALGFFCLAFSFYSPVHASGATLTIVPNEKSVSVGDTFSLTIQVASGSQSVNAVSTKVNFPKSFLRVNSVSKGGSVIDFWVQEPTLTNTSGSVAFEGVILNPGYTGSGGKVVTISFTALKEGIAALTMTDAAVLANDGNGTNVLTPPALSTVTIMKKIEAPIESPAVEPEPELIPHTDEVIPPIVEVIPGAPAIKFELSDYPVAVRQSDEVVIHGKGGNGPIVVYGVELGNDSIFKSTIFYENPTKIGYSVRMEAEPKKGGFEAIFKGLKPGKYAFYARDNDGEVTNIALIGVSNSFWYMVKMFLLEWWWLALIILALVTLFYLFWHLGAVRALHHQKHLAESQSQYDLFYAMIIQKLDTGIALTPEERIFLEKIRNTYKK